MIEMNKWNEGRLSLTYYITMACNNRCPYCYALGDLDNDKTFNHEVFNQFRDAFNGLDRTNGIELTLLGGEPLFVDEIERIKELDLTNTGLIIFSNLNYSESVFKERLKLIEGVDCWIACSLHESSNLVDVKRNILYLHDNFENVEVSFLIDTENILRMKDYVELIIHHGIPYTINPLRDGGRPEYVNFFDSDYGENYEMLNRWLDGSIECGEVTFGDRPLTAKEICEFRISEIAHVYWLQCSPTPFKISYSGWVSASCNHTYKSHISKGLKLPEMVLCSDKSCTCDLITYKKLLRPKDRDANKEFHEYFGD